MTSQEIEIERLMGELKGMFKEEESRAMRMAAKADDMVSDLVDADSPEVSARYIAKLPFHVVAHIYVMGLMLKASKDSTDPEDTKQDIEDAHTQLARQVTDIWRQCQDYKQP